MLVSRDDAGDVERVAGICDITHLLDSHPYDLSGGEQQRAALAKVLLTRPKILLLDEPTKGIDNFFKLQLADILKKLREDGVTILMVSHDVEFCAKYADLAGMFFDGGVITVNTPRKFFSQNSFYTTAANRMSRHVFKKRHYQRGCDRIMPKEQIGHQDGRGSRRALWTALIVFIVLIPLTVGVSWYLGDRKYYVASVLIMIYSMIPFFVSFEGRKPDARELVTLAVMCAIAVFQGAYCVGSEL